MPKATQQLRYEQEERKPEESECRFCREPRKHAGKNRNKQISLLNINRQVKQQALKKRSTQLEGEAPTSTSRKRLIP